MADEFTLLDYQATAKPLVKAVIKTWREASPILELLKFKVSNRLEETFVRFNSVTSPSWRKIGESFEQGKAEPDEVKERVFFMGKKVDIPREYVLADSLLDNRALQTEAILKGAAFDFNTAFIRNNNQGSVDIDAPVGLHYRVHNELPSTQRFDAALDISPDTSATNWQHQFFDKIDDLMDRVDGMPSDKVLLCGRSMFFRLSSALRSANQLFTDKEAGMLYTYFGKGGAKIVQMGYQSDGVTQILKDDENGTALTGSTDSSLYCVRFGEGYLGGFCQEMPNAEDKGETEDGVNFRTIVRFSPGIYIAHPRSVAVAYNFTAV